MTHCSKCKAARETYWDSGPGEDWQRCKACHHILARVRRKTASAARERVVAFNIIHEAYNLHEGIR